MMKKIPIILYLVFSILVEKGYTQNYSINTGIIDFYESKKSKGKSTIVISELSDALSHYNFITLVDRSKLDALIKEIELGQTGLINEASATKAGKVLGLQIMVIGTIMDNKITARAIHTETQKVISSASVNSMSDIGNLGRKLAAGIEVYLARENLKKLRNDNPDIDLRFWIEKKGEPGAKAGMNKTGRMKIGESIVFHFKSNKNGYVTIVDIQPCGDVVVLFPNDMSPSNNIKADTEYTIPSADDAFEIMLTEPVGRDTVVAFFTEKKVDWLDVNKLKGTGFKTVEEGSRVEMTRGISITSTKLKRGEWRSITLEIDVAGK